MIALIMGGSKSGKSRFAERLALHLKAESPLVYIATMPVHDEQDRQIVLRHQRYRKGKGFIVLEAEKSIEKIALPKNCILLIEDLPNLLANEMFDGGRPDSLAERLIALASRQSNTIIVSNTVDCDGILYPQATMDYIYMLSDCHIKIAQASDMVVECVCGLPQYIKGAWPCWII